MVTMLAAAALVSATIALPYETPSTERLRVPFLGPAAESCMVEDVSYAIQPLDKVVTLKANVFNRCFPMRQFDGTVVMTVNEQGVAQVPLDFADRASIGAVVPLEKALGAEICVSVSAATWVGNRDPVFFGEDQCFILSKDR